MNHLRAILKRYTPDIALLMFIVAATVGAFTGGLWASLGIGGALLLFLAVCAIEKRLPAPRTDIMLFILALLLTAALLNFHSFRPDRSWPEWVRLVTIVLPLSLLSSPLIEKHAGSARLFAWLPWAAMAGALSLGIELYLRGPLMHMLRAHADLTEYNRGVSYLVILAFPVMASLWVSKWRWPIALFILILLIPATFTESRASKLALMLGLLTTAIAYVQPVLTRRLLTIVPVLLIGWPFAAQRLFLQHYDWLKSLPASWPARVEIWDYMSYRILERPWLGWGLGTSSALPFQEPHGADYHFVPMLPAAHPHNAIIQLWVELGLPGLALGIVFMIMTLRMTARLDRRIAPFAVGGWMAALVISLVSYNLWTDSLLAAFALTAFAFALLERQSTTAHSSA